MSSKKNVVLVGFMGTGKTAVGKILAQQLNRPVVDVDAWIERAEGRKISEIFSESGESFFRALEKKAIHEIIAREAIVITTGGGAVIDAENRARLRQTGWVIALLAKPATIAARVKDAKDRPLLKGGDPLKKIESLLAARRAFYEDCDFSFETDGLRPAEVAQKILEALKGKI